MNVRVDRMMVRGGRTFGSGDRRFDDRRRTQRRLHFVRKQSTADRGDIVVALIGDSPIVLLPEKDYVAFA
jgi:repressor LexA